MLFFGNGVRLARWTPKQTGRGFGLTEGLAPLERVKGALGVVSGMSLKARTGNGHHEGTTGMLSGAVLQRTPGGQFATTFSAPSLDQIAARRIGGGTRFRPLEVGVSRRLNNREGTTLMHLSHNGPGSVNPPEYDPARLFARLFGGAGGPAPADRTLARALANRKSVLDAIAADLDGLAPRVSAADRARLELHLEHVRALEKRIGGGAAGPTAPGPATCGAPVAPAVPREEGGREPLAERSRAMSDLVALALACDQTRVFSVLFSGSVNHAVFWPVGATQGNHDMTHNEGGDQPRVHACVVFTMQQLAYLAEKLVATPEGTGSLLDRCAIYATTDVAEGRSHAVDDIPMLVLGKAGGALAPGVHYRSASKENTSHVAFSVLRAVGAGVTEYGAGAGRVTTGCAAIEG